METPRSRRFSGTNVLPRVGVPWRSHGASGRLGGYWGLSGSYERVVRVDESRSGTGEMGVRAVLRTGFQERSGAGRRVGLEWRGKGFSSRAYRAVPSPEIKGHENLTGDLTAGLTSRLTAHLPRGLTEWGSGDRLELAAAFPLGGLQNFRDHRVVDSQSLLDDSFP